MGIDLAVARYAAVCRIWRKQDAPDPNLHAFLAGWFMFTSAASKPQESTLGPFREAFGAGWTEAEAQQFIHDI